MTDYDLSDVAVEHIQNVARMVNEQDPDPRLEAVLAALEDGDETGIYPVYELEYTARNLREGPDTRYPLVQDGHGSVIYMHKGDQVEIVDAERDGTWGKIGRIWLSDTMYTKYEGNYVYMGSMRKI